MKHNAVFLSIFSLLLLSGCIFRALNPLFDDRELINNPALNGKWTSADGKSLLDFSLTEDKTYLLKQINRENYEDSTAVEGKRVSYDTIYFRVALGKIGKSYFVDLYPLGKRYESATDKVDAYYGTFYLPTHTFKRAVIQDKILILQDFDYDVLQQYVKEKKIKTGYAEYLSGETDGKPNYDIILTAKTKELQRFIANYSRNPDVFITPDTLYKYM